MNDEQIIHKINSLGDWFYQFDLNGNLTPVRLKYRIIRQPQRKNHILEPLLHLCGGSLTGKRVLDLGCNAGYWSLAAIENGAEFVLGIDARQRHLDQANFVFETKGIPREQYQFVLGNIFEFNFKDYGSFDIVMCLGLLYHINNPIELLKVISQINTDILIIDTNLSHSPGSFLEIRYDDITNDLQAIDSPLVIYPTKLAVIQMAQQFGYSSVILKPEFKNYTGLGDYKYAGRRAFICTKQTNLKNIKVKTESITAWSQLVDLSIWIFRSLLYSRFSRWVVHKLPGRWKSAFKRAIR